MASAWYTPGAIAGRAQTLNSSNGIALTNLGNLWTGLNRYDEALICAQKALEYEEGGNGKNTQEYIVTIGRLGSAYNMLGQFEVSLTWFRRARAGNQKLNLTNTADFGVLLNGVGLSYL